MSENETALRDAVDTFIAQVGSLNMTGLPNSTARTLVQLLNNLHAAAYGGDLPMVAVVKAQLAAELREVAEEHHGGVADGLRLAADLIENKGI